MPQNFDKMKTLKTIPWFTYSVICVLASASIIVFALDYLFNYNPIAVVVALICWIPFFFAVVDDVTNLNLTNKLL